MAKCYSAALPVLDQEFDDVDPKKTGMTARDFLLFCYYGGMIYTGGILTTSASRTSMCEVLVRPWCKERPVPDVHGNVSAFKTAPSTCMYGLHSSAACKMG